MWLCIVYSAEQLDGMSYIATCWITVILHDCEIVTMPEGDGMEEESSSTGSEVKSVKLP